MSQGPGSSTPPPQLGPSSRQHVPASPSPSERKMKQLGLLFAGAGFMAASVAVTRRAVLRRQLESYPRFYSSNRASLHIDSGERSLMAVQALGLATLNVTSFGIMLTGGLAYSFDLCNIGELRERTQAALRRPGNFSPEDEKELEKMMGPILERLGMQKTQEAQKVEPAAKATPSKK
ncbi:uncharacterized protein MAM_03250 [Metarhizium album ARSEF 1941]|uniref:Altered inheritance of mitochondria protein 11 n=1 Tax=Metarhizium album (strain ARSEF 1941) TaxID=1081103 RepID=A0A0B2WXP2_METAS|nr:uncharacterized protein MAM_03250 [Metarhizium album ARSEF 1941]KHN98788.1 hypothetical protein MAM_03250 [Metarhizium album ARSEF 1941]